MSDRIDNRNYDLSGLSLDIGPDDALQNCRLVRCQVNIAKPNGQWVSDNVFTDCDIHVEGRYTKVWPDCRFAGCRFTGHFHDMTFGSLAGRHSNRISPTALLVDCDFSKARMHFIWLLNCDAVTIKFPSWPHVTVIDNAIAISYLSRSLDPYALVLSTCFSASSSGEAAAVWNLKDYSKQAQKYVSTDDRFRDFDEAKGAYVMRPESVIDLERTRAVFENCPGVII